MNSLRSKTVRKITSVLLSASTTVWLVGASALMPMTVSADAATDALIAQLQAQIAALTAQINALAGSPSVPSAGGCSFTRDLTIGSQGSDVTCLQNYLTSTGHFSFSGGSTGYFGSITRTAVGAWQASNGVAPAAGYFGAISRAKYSSMVSIMPPTPTPPGGPIPPGPIVGGSLMVTSGIQPSASLFPEGAARVPFTVIHLTAGSSDVTVNSILVERTGLAQDAVIDGVVLLDESGVQLGLSKTLNSSHQVNLSEPVVVRAGQTRTLTIGANALSGTTALDVYAGQVAYLSVKNVVSNASSVSGSFPITGAGHTVNASLTIGSVTMARGATDPGVTATKRLDTVAYTFSGVRVTAGSAEKVYMKYIRWNQSGSASASDLANIKSVVDGVEYDVVVSSDGKYYTTSFPGNGLLIDKGFSKDISIKGDIVGGTLRTVAFDIAKRTDIGVVGETYGYGIIPPQTGTAAAPLTSAFTTSEDPWYDSAVVTIGVGTLAVASSNKAPAQNIAINLADQPLGAFEVTVKGETISVSRIAFNITLDKAGTDNEGANDDVDDITNIVLTDENGSIVAGPSDGSATDSSYTTDSGDGSVVFTDTITFPVGVHTYYLKGKIGTQIDNNVTVIASTTPSADFAGTVRGSISGNTITPSPTSALTLSTMTVKSGAFTISVSSVPIAQTVVAGTKGFLFANYILDAGSSGEDVRISAFPVEFSLSTNTSTLTNCALWDGASSVSSTVSPTASASTSNFTLNGGGLVVPKGSTKTLGLMCDIGSGASGFVHMGVDGDTPADPSVTGLTSGQDITEVINDGAGQRMSLASGGSLIAALDASSGPYTVVAAGQTNVELSRIKFTANTEDMDLKQVALQLTGVASNTPINLVGRKVTLWDGATQVGEATFPTADYATSSTITNFRIPRDGTKVLIVKGDIASISNSGPMTFSGDLLKVDYDGDNEGLNGNYATGVSSGSTVTPASNDTGSNGVRIFESFPTFEKVNISSTLINGEQSVLRWKVTANSAGDVGVAQFTLRIATTSANADSLQLYAFTDSSFSIPAYTGVNSSGQLMANAMDLTTTGVSTTAGEWVGISSETDIELGVETSAGATTTMQVPAGTTRYFEARVTMSNVDATGDSISVQLQGDAAFPVTHQNTIGSQSGDMSSFAGVAGVTNDDFVWTPNSTTTVDITANDFTNGFGLLGLSSSNMTPQSLSK